MAGRLTHWQIPGSCEQENFFMLHRLPAYLSRVTFYCFQQYKQQINWKENTSFRDYDYYFTQFFSWKENVSTDERMFIQDFNIEIYKYQFQFQFH